MTIKHAALSKIYFLHVYSSTEETMSLNGEINPVYLNL